MSARGATDSALSMRAAIFDMDGVLVDNTVFHFRAWQQVLQPYGVSLSMRQYVETNDSN